MPASLFVESEDSIIPLHLNIEQSLSEDLINALSDESCELPVRCFDSGSFYELHIPVSDGGVMCDIITQTITNFCQHILGLNATATESIEYICYQYQGSGSNPTDGVETSTVLSAEGEAQGTQTDSVEAITLSDTVTALRADILCQGEVSRPLASHDGSPRR